MLKIYRQSNKKIPGKTVLLQRKTCLLMKVTIVSAARPNFMKIAPLCRAIDAAREAGKNISYRVIYTGPQNDSCLEASLLSDLSMKSPDAYLGVSGYNIHRLQPMLCKHSKRNWTNIQPILCWLSMILQPA